MINSITSDIFAYDTHVHTSECSKCASADAASQVDFYKNKGYSGIIITDHFFNGNTTVPGNIPWSEKVRLFSLGYENAKKRGDEIGLDVFFGWEFGYCGTDLLTYGLNIDWLYENEDVHTLGIKDYCDLVHRSGGMIVHAHPFREDWYIEYIRLFPRQADAVEVFNANRKDFENIQALDYANVYDLRITSGSDNHAGQQSRYGGIAVKKKFETINDYINAVKSGELDIMNIND